MSMLLSSFRKLLKTWIFIFFRRLLWFVSGLCQRGAFGTFNLRLICAFNFCLIIIIIIIIQAVKWGWAQRYKTFLLLLKFYQTGDWLNNLRGPSIVKNIITLTTKHLLHQTNRQVDASPNFYRYNSNSINVTHTYFPFSSSWQPLLYWKKLSTVSPVCHWNSPDQTLYNNNSTLYFLQQYSKNCYALNAL